MNIMGMFDYVKIDYNIPDSFPSWINSETVWQTKNTPRQFMEHYTITKNGKLIHHSVRYEEVPKKDRPYPDNDGLRGWIGCMKSIPEKDIVLDWHGDMYLITSREKNDGEYEFFECKVRFSNGKLQEITRV